MHPLIVFTIHFITIIQVNDKFQTTSKRLSAEEERLGMDLKHLERDEVLVEEERKELEGTIQEQTSDMEKLRDQAKERLERVNEEIQDLRALLDAKESLAAELQSDFSAQETAISKIRSKFSRQLARLENKLTALKANRKEWESETQHHEHLKSSHESAIKAHSEALTAHEEMMKIIQEEISTAEKVEEIIVSEIVEAETREAADETSSELRELQADVLKCEAAADEANQVLMAAKATVNNLRDEIEQIEKQIPELEDQKKAAAASRDFKSAAKASKEIKEISARKGRLQEELDGEAIDRQSAAETNFENIIGDLDAKKSLAEAQEKEGASKELENLGERISRMHAVKRQVCSGENTVESVAASVLDSEIEALKARGAALGAKFGGWDEVLAEINAQLEAEAAAVAATDDEDDDAPTSTSPVADKQDEGSNDDNFDSEVNVQDEEENQLSREEAIVAYCQAKADLATAEQDLENAIENENYDAAAALDDTINALKVKMEKLGISEEDLSAEPTGTEEGEVPTDVVEEVENENGTVQAIASDLTGEHIGGDDDQVDDDCDNDDDNLEAEETAEPSSQASDGEAEEDDPKPEPVVVENGVSHEDGSPSENDETAAAKAEEEEGEDEDDLI